MALFFLMLAAQVVVPLFLVVLHAVIRPAGLFALVLRTVALLAFCLVLALVGMWAFPPWWTPQAYAVLALAATLPAWRRLRRRDRPAGRLRRGGEIAVSGLVLAAAVGLAVPAFEGRRTPEGAVDIAFPLEPGRYLVLNGGHHPVVNAHFMTLNNPGYAAYRGQSFAVDLIAIDAWGRRATTWAGSVDPAEYLIWGARVLAPCDGRVVAAEGAMVDHQVPDRDPDRPAGNFLLIDCGAFHVLLAHLRRTSLRVETGDEVLSGQVLAEVGNSGQSGEPHLHVHVQRGTRPGAPLAGEPVPLTLEGVFPRRNDRLVRVAAGTSLLDP